MRRRARRHAPAEVARRGAGGDEGSAGAAEHHGGQRPQAQLLRSSCLSDWPWFGDSAHDSADFALALQLQAEEEAAAAASSGEPGPSDDNDVELLSVTLHRADDGSLGLLVEYEGGLPVVAAPAPGGLVAGDVITAIDGVTLQPGWKLSDVIERRELHELQVLRHT